MQVLKFHPIAQLHETTMLAYTLLKPQQTAFLRSLRILSDKQYMKNAKNKFTPAPLALKKIKIPFIYYTLHSTLCTNLYIKGYQQVLTSSVLTWNLLIFLVTLLEQYILEVTLS